MKTLGRDARRGTDEAAAQNMPEEDRWADRPS
jgi:hypothetical protein